MPLNVKAEALTDLNSRPRIVATPLLDIANFEAGCAHPNVRSAYRVCLQLEADALEKAERGVKYKGISPVILARVLGYLLCFAASDTALANVALEIHSCNKEEDNYERLYSLGEHYFKYFIRAFKKYKGRTPKTTEYPSRASFDRRRNEIRENLKEAPRTHKEAKDRALERDGYQCPITGRYDELAELGDIVDIGEIHRFGGTASLQCAHILPESTNLDVDGIGEEAKAEYLAPVLAVLEHFGFKTELIQGEKIHSLFNVISMQMDAHYSFERLKFWLEPTDVPNRYHVKTSSRGLKLFEFATFISPDPEHLPFPSSQLLALHAACAKVARLSGAAEYLDECDHDLRSLGVLASDGTSSAVLHHAIWENLGEVMDIGV